MEAPIDRNRFDYVDKYINMDIEKTWEQNICQLPKYHIYDTFWHEKKDWPERINELNTSLLKVLDLRDKRLIFDAWRKRAHPKRKYETIIKEVRQRLEKKKLTKSSKECLTEAKQKVKTEFVEWRPSQEWMYQLETQTQQLFPKAIVTSPLIIDLSLTDDDCSSVATTLDLEEQQDQLNGDQLEDRRRTLTKEEAASLMNNTQDLVEEIWTNSTVFDFRGLSC